jgi:hypothetical protein
MAVNAARLVEQAGLKRCAAELKAEKRKGAIARPFSSVSKGFGCRTFSRFTGAGGPQRISQGRFGVRAALTHQARLDGNTPHPLNQTYGPAVMPYPSELCRSRSILLRPAKLVKLSLAVPLKTQMI